VPPEILRLRAGFTFTNVPRATIHVHFSSGGSLKPAEPALRKAFSALSTDFGSPPGFRPFSCRNPCEKAAEIVHGMCTAMPDEKGVQNMWKIRGYSAESPRKALCKTLRITCGDRADNSRKFDETGSSGWMTQIIESRIVTLDLVFSLSTTTTSCGLPLTSLRARRTL
jgi:hypothetical protein